MNDTSSVLSFDKISLLYDGSDVLILDDLSLDISSGKFVTVFGKSGCGKSTLLNIAAGLLKPTAGTACFRGQPITTVNTEVAYMTQADTLLPWRTVKSNIELPLHIRKFDKHKIDMEVERYLSLTDLSHSADKYPSQLSGGMRRRCLLARSLIYSPAILLMDEPFVGIDASLRESLHNTLRRTVEELNQTVLFVTHDVAEAALLSDEVAILGTSPASGATTLLERLSIPFERERNLAELRKSPEYSDMQIVLRKALDGAAA
jgi:NitT/TauT family transport system ATP-binding protein